MRFSFSSIGPKVVSVNEVILPGILFFFSLPSKGGRSDGEFQICSVTFIL